MTGENSDASAATEKDRKIDQAQAKALHSALHAEAQAVCPATP